MENNKVKASPKYMSLQADTQFELAERIDQAMAAAEQAVQLDQIQDCLLIWFEQVVDQLQEECALSQVPECTLSKAEDMEQVVARMVTACMKASQDDEQKQQAERLLMVNVLERSFLTALDLMQASGIWRFDIQRTFQLSQDRILASLHG